VELPSPASGSHDPTAYYLAAGEASERRSLAGDQHAPPPLPHPRGANRPRASSCRRGRLEAPADDGLNPLPRPVEARRVRVACMRAERPEGRARAFRLLRGGHLFSAVPMRGSQDRSVPEDFHGLGQGARNPLIYALISRTKHFALAVQHSRTPLELFSLLMKARPSKDTGLRSFFTSTSPNDIAINTPTSTYSLPHLRHFNHVDITLCLCVMQIIPVVTLLPSCQ
jgi:hypothetical protein